MSKLLWFIDTDCFTKLNYRQKNIIFQEYLEDQKDEWKQIIKKGVKNASSKKHRE